MGSVVVCTFVSSSGLVLCVCFCISLVECTCMYSLCTLSVRLLYLSVYFVLSALICSAWPLYHCEWLGNIQGVQKTTAEVTDVLVKGPAVTKPAAHASLYVEHLARACGRPHAPARARAHARARMHAPTHAFTRTREHAHMRTHVHAHGRTRAHTHAHTRRNEWLNGIVNQTE